MPWWGWLIVGLVAGLGVGAIIGIYYIAYNMFRGM